MGNEKARELMLARIKAGLKGADTANIKGADAAPANGRPQTAGTPEPMVDGQPGQKPATITSTGKPGQGTIPYEATVASASIPVPTKPSVGEIQRQLREQESQVAATPGGTVSGLDGSQAAGPGSAAPGDRYADVQLTKLLGSNSPYIHAFMPARSALESMKEIGYFSEHGLEMVQVNILIEADGTPSVEVTHPKDWTQESTYSIEKIIIDRMEKALPEKVEPPHQVGQGMRIVYPPLHVNPHFWDLEVKATGEHGDPIQGDIKNTQMLQLELRKFLNLNSAQLQKKGVDLVKITLKLKKTRDVVLVAVEPAGAREILVDGLMKELKEFSAAYRDVKSPMLFPKIRDVIWPFEHKVERTWQAERAQINAARQQQAGGPAVAPPAPVSGPITVPNAPAIQAQQPAVPGALGNGGVVESITVPERSGPAPKLSDVNPDHLIAKVIESTDGRISFSVCLMNPETGKDRELQRIELKTGGSSKKTTVGGMDADVDFSDKDKPVLLLQGKPVPTVMANPVAAESQAAQTMVAAIAVPAKKPSYRSEAEAAVVGAVASGTLVSIATGWFQQAASKIPHIGQITIPQHVDILGQSIDSAYIAGAAAVLTATVSAVLIALGVGKKKKGDKQ